MSRVLDFRLRGFEGLAVRAPVLMFLGFRVPGL